MHADSVRDAPDGEDDLEFRIHPSVRVDSGLVVIESGDVDDAPLLLRFVETPPPYVGEVPAIVLFYHGQVWYEDVDALFREAPEDSLLLASIYPERGINDEFWSWSPFALLEGPDDFAFRPEHRSAHALRFSMRWRRHVGPWYEVLVDAPRGHYMWTHVGDPRVTAVHYADVMLQTTGSRTLVHTPGFGLLDPEGKRIEEPVWSDTLAWRSLQMAAMTPIRSAPSDSAQIIVPAVVTGYDCLIGREIQGQWVRVVSPDGESCDSGELNPPLRGDGGWVRWTDGRELFYAANHDRYLRERERHDAE